MLIPLGVMAVAGRSLGPPSAYELISTINGNGVSGTIEFTSIPTTFQHLQLRYVARSTETTNEIRITFNGVASGYARHSLFASSVSSNASTNQVHMEYALAMAANFGANSFAGGIMDILDYKSTNKNTTMKLFYGEKTGGGGRVSLSSGLMTSLAAVSSIRLVAREASFNSFSRFSLYGIRG